MPSNLPSTLSLDAPLSPQEVRFLQKSYLVLGHRFTYKDFINSPLYGEYADFRIRYINMHPDCHVEYTGGNAPDILCFNDFPRNL